MKLREDEIKRGLILLRTSDHVHSFINWLYDGDKIKKLCKKAKRELYNQILFLAEKVKNET